MAMLDYNGFKLYITIQYYHNCNGRFQKISIPYHTTDGFQDFRRGGGGGVHVYGILRAWGGGGIYDWISEGTGELNRWDFWSRKCRVSSLKALL